MSGPRGKIPYLTVSFPDPAPQPPSTLADSTFISRQLVSEGWADDLNADLSPFEQAQDLSIRALLEDKLYFYGVYERWEQNYYTMRPGTLAALPYPMQVVVGAIAYRKTHSTLYGQGTGRLTPKEITGLKTQVWESVEAMLSEARGKSRGKKGLFWLLGKNEPTEADTTLFGFIASGLVCAA